MVREVVKEVSEVGGWGGVLRVFLMMRIILYTVPTGSLYE